MSEYSSFFFPILSSLQFSGWIELVSGPVWFASLLFQCVTPVPGETLLQQKLQESNRRLYHNVGQTVQQVYGSASKEVYSDLSPTIFIKYVNQAHTFLTEICNTCPTLVQSLEPLCGINDAFSMDPVHSHISFL